MGGGGYSVSLRPNTFNLDMHYFPVISPQNYIHTLMHDATGDFKTCQYTSVDVGEVSLSLQCAGDIKDGRVLNLSQCNVTVMSF